MPKLDFSAVVLAGGASLRMGRDKAWLPAGRQTFLERSLNLCRSLHPRELFISGRPGEDYSPFPYPVLLDLEPGTGPLSGIERALHAATTPLVLVLAVDLPLMTSPFLASLLAHCDRLTGCLPRHQHRLEPLAAVYPRRCHEFAIRLLNQGQRSAARFAEACLREHAVKILKPSKTHSAALTNCNTPADLAAASLQS